MTEQAAEQAAEEVLILQRSNKSFVSASLIEDVSEQEIKESHELWKTLIDAHKKELEEKKIPKSQWPQHHHWDWTKLYQYYSKFKLAYKFFGIKFENQMQGLVLLSSDETKHTGRIDSQKGKPLIYVEYVATAPWNDKDIAPSPKFGLIGTRFMEVAIRLSINDGFEGRIGLHSLKQAEEFYRDSVCMTDLGQDTEKRMRYFEMTPEQAKGFLE